MKSNQHTQSIPIHVLISAQTKLEEVIALIFPYLLSLTPSERKKTLKMGPKTLAFVEKARDFAYLNPTLVPSYLDMDEFNIDFTDAHGIWNIISLVLQLLEALEDTEMIAGGEAYQHALAFYKSVKAAAEQNVVGAKAIYEDLRIRVPQVKRKIGETETETITDTVKKTITDVR
jgi:hypothetical protein